MLQFHYNKPKNERFIRVCEGIKLLNCSWENTNIRADTIDFIYTDPPYGMKYCSNIPGSKEWNTKGNSDSKFDTHLVGDDIDGVNWKEFVEFAYTILKNDTFLVMHCNIPLIMNRFRLFENAGFKYKGCIAWNKKFAIGGDLVGAMKRDWEPIVYFSKGKPKLQKVQVLRNGIITTRKRISEIADWEFQLSKKEKVGFPTQKPIALCKQIISLMSQPQQLIYDPFCGSGSIVIAARQLDRRVISTEVDANAFQIASDRIRLEIS